MSDVKYVHYKYITVIESYLDVFTIRYWQLFTICLTCTDSIHLYTSLTSRPLHYESHLRTATTYFWTRFQKNFYILTLIFFLFLKGVTKRWQTWQKFVNMCMYSYFDVWRPDTMFAILNQISSWSVDMPCTYPIHSQSLTFFHMSFCMS